VNLIARSAAATKPAFLFCSHYDTKIFDSFRFVGANDGGSSTGLLLEMARVLALEPKLAQKIEARFLRRRRSGRKLQRHRRHLR